MFKKVFKSVFKSELVAHARSGVWLSCLSMRVVSVPLRDVRGEVAVHAVFFLKLLVPHNVAEGGVGLRPYIVYRHNYTTTYTRTVNYWKTNSPNTNRHSDLRLQVPRAEAGAVTLFETDHELAWLPRRHEMCYGNKQDVRQ